jgi:hypothetical protein
VNAFPPAYRLCIPSKAVDQGLPDGAVVSTLALTAQVDEDFTPGDVNSLAIEGLLHAAHPLDGLEDIPTDWKSVVAYVFDHQHGVL